MKRWDYKGVADITIGEAQESKAPKIVLISLIVVLTILGILAFYFREYIRDVFITPEIILSANTVSVELASEFDAESYIISKGENYSITGDTVDTSVLNAEYTVVYTTWNKVNSSSTELKVKIVDDTAPTIELQSNNKKLKLDENNSFTLIMGKSTDTMLGTKDFDINRDITVEVADNHTSKDDLLATLKITPDKPDFTLGTNEFSKNITIRYEVTDEVGLTSFKNIIAIVVNGLAEIPQQTTVTTTTPVETEPPITTTTVATEPIIDTEPPYTTTTTTTYYEPPVSSEDYPSYDTQSPSPPPSSGPFIYGVHDVSVPYGTGLQEIVNQLLDGVYGSGYVSMEYRYVNPTIPGTYTVTFTSTDGVTESCTVTIYE